MRKTRLPQLIGALGVAIVLAALVSALAPPPAPAVPWRYADMIRLLRAIGWTVRASNEDGLDPERQVVIVLDGFRIDSRSNEKSDQTSNGKTPDDRLAEFVRSGGFVLSAGDNPMAGLVAKSAFRFDALPLEVSKSLSPDAGFDGARGPLVSSGFKPMKGATVLAWTERGAYAASVEYGSGSLLHFADDDFFRRTDPEYEEAVVLLHQALSPYWGRELVVLTEDHSVSGGSAIARLLMYPGARAAGAYLVGALAVLAWALAVRRGAPAAPRLPASQSSTANAQAAASFYRGTGSVDAADMFLATRFARRVRMSTRVATDLDRAARAFTERRGMERNWTDVASLARPKIGLTEKELEERWRRRASYFNRTETDLDIQGEGIWNENRPSMTSRRTAPR